MVIGDAIGIPFRLIANTNSIFSFDVTVGNESVTIPTLIGYNYTGIINYGDGTELSFSSYNDINFTHTYSAGTYTIEIMGIFEAINVNNGLFAPFIISLNSFGSVGLKFISFFGCYNINSKLPTLPCSLVSISDYAFSGCTNLTGGLIMPSGITSIGKYAFFNCSSLTGELVLPPNITIIDDYTFNGCSGLTGQLKIPAGMITLGNRSFRNCSGFTGSLILPSTVTTIDDYAFLNCSGFNGILTLSSGITVLNFGAFRNCSGFNGTLTLPSTVTTIDDYVFNGCSGFTSVDSYPGTAPTVGTQGLDFTGSPIPLHIPVTNSGYGINPWTDISIFSSITNDL